MSRIISYLLMLGLKDEQGRSYEVNPQGDNLAVRMPLPEMRRN